MRVGPTITRRTYDSAWELVEEIIRLHDLYFNRALTLDELREYLLVGKEIYQINTTTTDFGNGRQQSCRGGEGHCTMTAT